MVIQTERGTWPDADPPNLDDPYWEFNNNLNCNGVAYKKVEVAPGHWQWQVDQELQRRAEEEQRRIRDLYWALRTRVLSAQEMQRVEELGLSLVVIPYVPYMEADKQRELNDALLQQFRIRMAAEKSNA